MERVEDCGWWQIGVPSELLVRVFGFLSDQDRLNASKSCRFWREVSSLPQLWRTRSFSIREGDRKERRQLARYMKKYGSYLQHLTIVLEAGKKARKTKAQLRRVSSEIEDLLNTKLLRSFTFKCNDELMLGLLGTKKELLTAVARMIEQQEDLSVVNFTDASLCSEEGYQLMRALATPSVASRLKSLTLFNFFQGVVTRGSPVFLDLIGRFESLEKLALSVRYVDNDVLEKLGSGRPDLKRLLLYVDESDDNAIYDYEDDDYDDDDDDDDDDDEVLSKTIDWQRAAKNVGELSVWMNVYLYYPMSPRTRKFLHPKMPLDSLCLECTDPFTDRKIEEEINDIIFFRGINHYRLKHFIMKVPRRKRSPWNRAIALVDLVVACPSLVHLGLQMTLSQDTLLQMADAAQPPGAREEKEGGHSAAQTTPRLQIHVEGCHPDPQENLWNINPFCSVHVCNGSLCDPPAII